MTTELEHQVAEMPCPVCCEFWDVMVEALSGSCSACQGIGLRWPPLSLPCDGEDNELPLE